MPFSSYLFVSSCEHYLLNFVELVESENSLRVFAVSANFFSKARTQSKQPHGKIRFLKNFVGVIRGERHLGCSDQSFVIFQPVVVLFPPREIPCSGEKFRFYY